MVGQTPGIRVRGESFVVRHGNVCLGTARILRDARIMRDLYTIASRSRVPLWFPVDTYAFQIAAVEDMNAEQRSNLCQELIEAFAVVNGTTLRPLINGIQRSFATRADAVAAIYLARGGFSRACTMLCRRFIQEDE